MFHCITSFILSDFLYGTKITCLPQNKRVAGMFNKNKMSSTFMDTYDYILLLNCSVFYFLGFSSSMY